MGSNFSKRRAKMASTNIHTTINLSITHAALLDEAARRLGVKRTKIVILLLQKTMERFKQLKRKYGAVKYQEHCIDATWKKVHVFYESNEYEVCIDMRKFCKWSVSALVAMGIECHLDELLAIGKNNIRGYCDRYHIHDYYLDGKLDKNIICWHIKWILSKELAKRFTS